MERRSAGSVFGRRRNAIVFTMLQSIFINVLVAVTLLLSQTAQAQGPLVVRHNFFEHQSSDQLSYRGQLLELLLEKSKSQYGPYRMERGSAIGYSQNRAFSQLELGNLDIIASMTNEDRENQAIALRYCLYKGLLGVRLGMGTLDVVEKLNRISSREELNHVALGQVFDWPDYAIQKDAGLKVLSLPDLTSGTNRLKLGTFQLFPLGIVEVGPIAKANNLAVISTWAIAYPTAYYFFVSKTKPDLAQRLVTGFERALKDGSFDQLFNKRVGPMVAAAGLEKRTIYYLPNRYLPKATPIGRKELWHPLVQSKLQ